ncbi:hypothetical protein [Microbacterium thalassium]|uniref:Uncharacterized protein n=1 Tax=Microbacterium thalassium TaxID=362649 RepID=A0A7X0KT61_9MICO|nr:hypothetical protein [Microbacterium thalassium]MBB6389747.1 hypothetical protein [Microbacterium thalassium]
MDELDERLRRARAGVDDPAVAAALHALVEDRTHTAPRHRRVLGPAIGIGAALVLVSGGTVAATEGILWNITDPDLVISRSWTDVEGTFLGTCETRVKADQFPTQEIQDAARDYLAALDIEHMAPNTEVLAGGLNSVGRLDDLPRLVAGANPNDWDVTHVGDLITDPLYTDAWLMQDALAADAMQGMGEALLERWPDELRDGVGASGETHCSTDPIEAPAP